MNDNKSFKIEIIRNFPGVIDENDGNVCHQAMEEYAKEPFLVYIDGVKQEGISGFQINLQKKHFVDKQRCDLFQPLEYTVTREIPFAL